MTHKVTWLAGQDGCARVGVAGWAPRCARAASLAAAARAEGRGGGGPRGRRGRGLLRLRRPPAARGPQQLGGRAPVLAGGERPEPEPEPRTAATSACQGALSVPGRRCVYGGRPAVLRGGPGPGQGLAGRQVTVTATPQGAHQLISPEDESSLPAPWVWGAASFRALGSLPAGQSCLILAPYLPLRNLPLHPMLLMNSQTFKSRGWGFKPALRVSDTVACSSGVSSRRLRFWRARTCRVVLWSPALWHRGRVPSMAGAFSLLLMGDLRRAARVRC